jgi:hypothetical protein
MYYIFLKVICAPINNLDLTRGMEPLHRNRALRQCIIWIGRRLLIVIHGGVVLSRSKN